MAGFVANVFVASSGSAYRIAVQVADVLQDLATTDERFESLHAQAWKTTFDVGTSTLESILGASGDYSFGVFLFAPDDQIISGSETTSAPRDNVVYELGLFTGALGRDRVFVLRGEGVKVPSDLAGITYATYREPASASASSLRSVVEAGCDRILSGIAATMAKEALARKQTPAPQGSDLLLAQVRVDLQRGELEPIDARSVTAGLLVVHPAHGLGTVLAADPPSVDNPLIRVRFESGAGPVDVALLPSELFTTKRRPR